jgi:hypothetical protein
MSEETKERAKPGPKPQFGERKPLLTRVDPELALEFEGYCAEAGISVTEGLQRLIEQLCQKKRSTQKGGRPVRPSSAGPAPKSVTITALVTHTDLDGEVPAVELPEVAPIAKPSLPSRASPWVAISAKVREIMGADAYEQSGLELVRFVSLEAGKLLLLASSPFFASDIQERLGELLAEVASELTGEPCDVVVKLDPAYAVRMRQEDQRVAEEKEAKETAAKERTAKVAQLVKLYQQRTVEAARQIETLLAGDSSLLAPLGSFLEKQIRDWLSGVNAGTSYQQGKESEFKGPRRGGKR